MPPPNEICSFYIFHTCLYHWQKYINIARTKCAASDIIAVLQIANECTGVDGSVIQFSVTSALYGYQHSFGHGTGPVFLTVVSCTGSELSLLSCSNSAISGGYCAGGVGVVCPCKFYVILSTLKIMGDLLL